MGVTNGVRHIHMLGHIKMRKRINQFLLVSLTVIMVSSCDSRQKFDSNEWKKNRVDWWMTDVRENMVDDLIQSDTLIGLTGEQVIELLGEPKSENEVELEYLIREKYGTDIDPEYISYLLLGLDNEEKVRNYKIEK